MNKNKKLQVSSSSYYSQIFIFSLHKTNSEALTVMLVGTQKNYFIPCLSVCTSVTHILVFCLKERYYQVLQYLVLCVVLFTRPKQLI